MRRLFKVGVTIILIAVAVSWLTSIAYGNTNDSVQLNGSINDGILVEAAPPEAAPSVTIYGNAIGSIMPGDLFYIDSTNVTQDITLNLNITNTDELVHCFKYLTLKVIVYTETGVGQWEKVHFTDGSTFPDTYLTMNNGLVTFNLPGRARYKVAIDSGCYNSYPARPANGDILPRFYLEAESI